MSLFYQQAALCYREADSRSAIKGIFFFLFFFSLLFFPPYLLFFSQHTVLQAGWM